MKVLVTEPESFIGKNLIENLKNIRDGKNRTRPYVSISDIYEGITQTTDVDIVIVFSETEGVDSIVNNYKSSSKIIYIIENKYRETETIIKEAERDYNILVYRFPLIVGKWQSPDEDKGIIAFLCDAVANDRTFDVRAYQNRRIEVVFIDDLIEEVFDAIEGHPHRCNFPNEGENSSDPTAQYDGITPVPDDNGIYCYSPKSFRTTLGNVYEHLKEFDNLNMTSIIPEIPQGSFEHKLYSMYLSYLPVSKMSYPLKMNVDNRGVFTELVKTVNNGQVSINIARPGIVRGQHWHNSKWEIFIVVSGHGLIQERKIGTEEVINFEVRGEDMRAVILLPGYSHNIINLEKDRDLVTVMWANEQFDINNPDTFFEPVEYISS